jgi:predicted transcriptional regulator
MGRCKPTKNRDHPLVKMKDEILGGNGDKSLEDAASPIITSKRCQLPGQNDYDDIVTAGSFSFAEAKQREEVKALMGEKALQLKIATQTAQLAYDKEKIEVDARRGELITKEESKQRIAVLVSAFNELLRMVICDAGVKFNPLERELLVETLSSKSNDAMGLLADAVASRKNMEQISVILQSAFR